MVYVDTNILIYLLEKNERYVDGLILTMEQLLTEGQTFLTSVLTLSEFLAKRLDSSPTMFDDVQALSLAAIDETIACKAGLLQRQHTLKIGDALHLATSIERGCQTFFTNDAHLASIAAAYGKVLRPSAAE